MKIKYFLSICSFVIQIHFASGQSIGLDWVHQIGNGSGGLDEPTDLFVDNFGNFYVSGFYEGSLDFNPSSTEIDKLTSNGDYDAFLAKYDSFGNYLWAVSIGGENSEKANSVAVDDDGNVYLTGYYEDGCYFNPTDSIELLSPVDYKDIF